jgi:hypothetical protein
MAEVTIDRAVVAETSITALAANMIVAVAKQTFSQLIFPSFTCCRTQSHNRLAPVSWMKDVSITAEPANYEGSVTEVLKAAIAVFWRRSRGDLRVCRSVVHDLP